MTIKKGDTVKIIKGNEAGKVGEVLKVYPDKNQAVVKGARIVKKHIKPGKTTQRGGIVDKTLPIEVSNLQLICPNCSKPTRVAYSLSEKSKSSLCKKCKKTLI